MAQERVAADPNNLSWTTGNHSTKFGVDWRSSQIDSFFNPDAARPPAGHDLRAGYVDDIANESGADSTELAAGGTDAGQTGQGGLITSTPAQVYELAILLSRVPP